MDKISKCHANNRPPLKIGIGMITRLYSLGSRRFVLAIEIASNEISKEARTKLALVKSALRNSVCFHWNRKQTVYNGESVKLKENNKPKLKMIK